MIVFKKISNFPFFNISSRSAMSFQNGRQLCGKKAWANLKTKELSDLSIKTGFFGGKMWSVRWTRNAYFLPTKLANKLYTEDFR